MNVKDSQKPQLSAEQTGKQPKLKAVENTPRLQDIWPQVKHMAEQQSWRQGQGVSLHFHSLINLPIRDIK